ncbi:hypothetical protein LGM85_13855 [Burkholderia multivorans]|uniref:hypothetical protein n=1 Tax=Burkholderia multivorans TaxID=87883 RepID=UPI001C24CA20|nr:hypothetical protein [Burkholderia multivorans]MBU9438704.1 hypothetical protein [Burkholderia multivorans]MBU9598366.1 hypothetical protein [Burkholderia multivorans]MCA8485018.1 hypothetical protein [Burkholderia multivorans]MDN7873748.1 hypothetical protein [Burkholderia multivorans]
MSTVKSSSAVPSPKPDYTDAAFRGALMRDHYAADHAAQCGFVSLSDLGDVARAADALRTVARLAHNSLCEPEMSDAEPLGLSAHLGLLNATEVIAKYLVKLEERMRETADSYAQFKKEQEARHG